MLKQVFLLAALFWTGLILFFCLVNSNELKQITIPNFDKVIHVFFHFVFTALWFLFFKKKLNDSSKYKVFTISVVLSLFFGILIELLQQYFTTTRTGDIFDIMANLLGALLAVASIVLINKFNGIVDKI
ncbi:MAG: VanZ family protein [Bacteroidota bacterium]